MSNITELRRCQDRLIVDDMLLLHCTCEGSRLRESPDDELNNSARASDHSNNDRSQLNLLTVLPGFAGTI
jgi:hypothetical protein